jgi:hypothetical protein
MRRILFAIAAVSGVCAQDISISGKVSDASGKPLGGAIVRLVAARMADTTGPDGMFDFTGKSIAILGGTRGLESIRYEVNRFVFQSAGAGDLEVSLHDSRGRRTALLHSGRLRPGRTEIPIAAGSAHAAGAMRVTAAGALFLRVRFGGDVFLHKLPPLAPGPGRSILIGTKRSAAAPKRSAAPAASAGPAASAALDWIQAYKPGYSPQGRQIVVYSGLCDLTLGALTGPDFGPNVAVFDPAMPMADIQARIDAVHDVQAQAQFGIERYAMLFKPGAYALNVDVGYYTQAAGLGPSPADVAIAGSARSITTTANNNVTIQFWRSVENLTVTPAAGSLNTWAVSQAAPMRRVHVKGSLALSLGGWASGGFLADSKIDNKVISGSQQQWFSRNTEWGAWEGGVWNMFFAGVSGAPAGAWPLRPYSVIPETPLVREKPFLRVDPEGKYSVFVPTLRSNAVGTSWSKGPAAGESLPLDLFHLARPESDDAASINAALAGGKHLLLLPGIYMLDRPIQVPRPGTVVLGLGLPTLVPYNGTAALSIADVDGVKAAGIVIDAGPVDSPVLLQVGEPGSAKDHIANPTSLHDIFLRVGGPRIGSAAVSVVIDSRDVIGDHFWVWRADHGAGAKWDVNKGRNGLIVNGDRVTFYGLFVEHYQEYQTLWNGEGGRVYFYQSEMPYDPPAQEAWGHDGVKGWAAYKVADKVKTHEAWGLGAYCAFKAPSIQSDHGVEAPAAPGVKIRHAVSIWLNGAEGTGIGNVLNDSGGAVSKARPKATID